ncbi:MAG: glycosyltransferase family 2 protein [Candidatus Omnitrophota bacterium]|nr:glycosyltransferase family 2 protein [Candidatus Omnitrophota bacterium]
MTTNAPSNPRVTVLLPVYNGMPYLAEAIESVLAQTFTDFELLIIDDASTDESVACIQRYPDPRIRLVRNERNMGQVWSLNRGLVLARAPYLARLDQDDRCLPDRLRQQVAVLDRHADVGLVGSWLYHMELDGRQTAVVGMRQVQDYGSFLGAVLTYASPIDHPTAMFRRAAALAAGSYDESFKFCEDYALWCTMARIRWSAVVLRTPLIIRRVHEAQQSRTHAAVQQENARRAHHALVASLDAEGTAQRLSQVLRMEEGFWDTCPSQASVQQALDLLEAFLQRVERVVALTQLEAAHLRHRVYWWMGHGALMGILQRRYQSLPVYRFALRGGWRMARSPTVWVYPVCLALSPMFVPAVRRFLVELVHRIGRQKYVVRLLSHRLGAWIGRSSPRMPRAV